MKNISIAMAVAVACAPAALWAQQGEVEEVVVTALKRAESLEDAPVSVSAFTESEIESAGIQTPSDFIALTPNVTLVQTQNAGNSFINVRGVSQARNSELSVAVLVDGVLLANPAQFNQQLFDIEQIEVLRGPQGALYGRNAIGGAITINTRKPTDEFEGSIEVGGDNGPGFSVRGAISGPVGNSDTLKFRASGSYVDTEGVINNTTLGDEADPYRDASGRLKLLWEPSDTFSADFRVSYSDLDTQALYFRIAADADDTSLPVQVNNPGENTRKIFSTSLKLDWETPIGTVTSITSYDELEELLTGDQFDFLPPANSFLNLDTSGFGDFIRFLTGDAVVDLSQTQYLDTDAISQELKLVSNGDGPLQWIIGAYLIQTDRFISTGNQIDRGFGVFPVERIPRPSVFVDPTDPSPQLGLLVDAQDNFAWSLFGELSYQFTDQLQGSFSLRYDEDRRENTTLTDPLFDPTGIGLVPGTEREETFSDLQPKAILSYQPGDNTTIYGGYSRGFRSGGFNQSGVGAAVPEPGINDLFAEQIADTFEIGFKSVLGNNRVTLSASAYYTDFDNAYFFFFDPGTSTQNLGSIPETEYMGLEFEVRGYLTDTLSGYIGLGVTDSEIKVAADPADEGNEAPLVSDYTLNIGGLWRQPVNLGGLDNAYAFVRADFQVTGDTYWDPGNISVRSPVELLDMRVGFEVEDDWTVALWARNLLDEDYNAEFSPGPDPSANFLWPGQPRRWGMSFTKRFGNR